MTALHLIFYLFAGIALCAGVAVISLRNPVHSVLSLVVTFFAMAGIWMILHAEFLSLILILVYVGAVMTLFLFVVMMLNIHVEGKRGRFIRYFPVGALLVLLMLVIIFMAISPQYVGLTPPPLASSDEGNTLQLGRLLYTDYAYPFEMAGIILLAAIIAAITLAFRGPHKRKIQVIGKQVSATPAGRVRLVNMLAEKKGKS